MDTRNFSCIYRASEIEDDNPLTHEQFEDLYLYIAEYGHFVGISGISWRELANFVAIDEPTINPEGLTIYLSDGWPVAVYEFDTGFRGMPGIENILATGRRHGVCAFGGSMPPGDTLDDDTDICECPRCAGGATFRSYKRVEGSTNMYYRIHCECGYYEDSGEI